MFGADAVETALFSLVPMISPIAGGEVSENVRRDSVVTTVWVTAAGRLWVTATARGLRVPGLVPDAVVCGW